MRDLWKTGECMRFTFSALFFFSTCAYGQLTSPAMQQQSLQQQQAAMQAKQGVMQNGQTQTFQTSSLFTPLPTPQRYGRAGKPTFSPRPRKYSSATSVTISDDAPKAIIHYTTDGRDPDTTPLSTLYTGPILVSSTMCLKAVAQSPLYSSSKVATAKYIIIPTTASITSQQVSCHKP